MSVQTSVQFKGLKKFAGAPFGVQMKRFSVAGTHPRSRKPGTFTQIPYDPRSMDEKTRRRGPGMYREDMDGFHPRAVELRAAGPGWARQQEMEIVSATPYLLNKELFTQRRELKRRVGPGSYNFRDSIQLLGEKPSSVYGICEPLAERFGRANVSFTPGPGTYGKKGIPHTAMEEKSKQSFSCKGMLDSETGHCFQMAPGCRLGPGTYRLTDSIDQFLSKVVSLRGPYDLFSSDRGKPIITGHFAVPGCVKLGPGQYEIKSLFEEWDKHHKNYKGKLGKVAQYPHPPTERNYNSVLSQCPKEQYFPGPGAHGPSCPGDWPKVVNVGTKAVFLSSAERMDKRAQKNFSGNHNAVGVGRYNMKTFHEAQHVNSFNYLFKANEVWPESTAHLAQRERLRGKDQQAVASQPPPPQ